MDFGKAVGLGRPTVSELCQRGVVDLTRGLEQSIVDYCKHLRERAAGRGGSTGEYDLTEERARLSYHQANMEALKEFEHLGHLVNAQAVIATWQNMIAAARAKLLGMPVKLAPVLMGAVDLKDIEEKLRGEIHDALDELAGSGLPPDIEERLHAIERGMEKSSDADRKRVGRKAPKTLGRRQ